MTVPIEILRGAGIVRLAALLAALAPAACRPLATGKRR